MEPARTILVTGASTGIGRACALHFAKLGFLVYAGVRQPAHGESLEAESARRIQPLTLDVTDALSISSSAAVLGDTPLDGLINNAGIAVAGPLELLPIEELRRQFEINVIGLVAVTQALLPALRRARGRIVNIGSIAGRSALPCNGAYSASKFAVEALTDALRMELQPWGISVSVIEPGAVSTPIWDKGLAAADRLNTQADPARYQLYSALLTKIRRFALDAGQRAIPVEAVVNAVQHALTSPRPRTRYPVGKDAKLRLLLNPRPDRLKDRLILNRIAAL